MDVRRRDRTRVKFTRRTYLVLTLILAISFLQWGVVSIMLETRQKFQEFSIWCPITFCLAVALFCVFILVGYIRSHIIFKWVELYVIAMFILVITSWLPEVLVYFVICVLSMIVALVIGCNLSFSMDMTQSIAPIFITCYILVAASMYALMIHLYNVHPEPYAFMVFEIILHLVMLLLVMLHAQTIRGDRFIQMSTDDYLLAALLLYHEFLAIYAMTFYWQINYSFFTSKDFFWLSTSIPGSTMRNPQTQPNIAPLDDIDAGSDYNLDFDDYDKKPSD
ncbi:uncharacterized protein LOC110179974 isoform X2 [Drosophila serrata]|uniref:uncharacterized protein LOC110179974 isoform X2 n=1 Tax=Drosophila serrata TaxID=7274 RepID=UPI000A1D07FD|nr:uncharacterized protein LOC110179974 isoform X2 [Drosophila serrata]